MQKSHITCNRFLHSWPTEKTMGKEDFFAFQRAIQEGIPDWDYRAKIWKPPVSGGSTEGALPDSAFETTERVPTLSPCFCLSSCSFFSVRN